VVFATAARNPRRDHAADRRDRAAGGDRLSQLGPGGRSVRGGGAAVFGHRRVGVGRPSTPAPRSAAWAPAARSQSPRWSKPTLLLSCFRAVHPGRLVRIWAPSSRTPSPVPDRSCRWPVCSLRCRLVLVIIAETGRPPVDNPATHLAADHGARGDGCSNTPDPDWLVEWAKRYAAHRDAGAAGRPVPAVGDCRCPAQPDRCRCRCRGDHRQG